MQFFFLRDELKTGSLYTNFYCLNCMHIQDNNII